MSVASRSKRTYPLQFEPVLKAYSWGGRNFETHLGRRLPPGRTAESWEISAHPNGPTRVSAGPLSGRTLPELLAELGEDLVGHRNRSAADENRFPILIKLLDAAEWLSVQVHPDDAYALEHEGDLGKTEMWVVLHAEPSAELILGFKTGVGRERFADAVARGLTDELLHRVPVAIGDVFFLPPGTIHAIGPGIVLTEVQQSSDVTYRIFDWNRAGQERPLHIDQALEVLDFKVVEPGSVDATWEPGDGTKTQCLTSCRHFETHRLQLEQGAVWEGDCNGSTFEAWAVLSGQATLESPSNGTDLAAVQWILLPASLGIFRWRAVERCTLMRVLTP